MLRAPLEALARGRRLSCSGGQQGAASMMEEALLRAQTYRAEARRLREMAEDAGPGRKRDTLVLIAEGYEQLALNVEAAAWRAN
jgi:hypothetical protein